MCHSLCLDHIQAIPVKNRVIDDLISLSLFTLSTEGLVLPEHEEGLRSAWTFILFNVVTRRTHSLDKLLRLLPVSRHNFILFVFDLNFDELS